MITNEVKSAVDAIANAIYLSIQSKALQQEHLTMKDAASYLGVSYQTILRWIRERKITPITANGRKVFRRTDLDAFACGGSI